MVIFMINTVTLSNFPSFPSDSHSLLYLSSFLIPIRTVPNSLEKVLPLHFPLLYSHFFPLYLSCCTCLSHNHLAYGMSTFCDEDTNGKCYCLRFCFLYYLILEFLAFNYLVGASVSTFCYWTWCWCFCLLVTVCCHLLCISWGSNWKSWRVFNYHILVCWQLR